MVTAKLSGFKRVPLQARHGLLIKYFSISSRIYSESVSWKRLSRLGMTPSNGPQNFC